MGARLYCKSGQPNLNVQGTCNKQAKLVTKKINFTQDIQFTKLQHLKQDESQYTMLHARLAHAGECQVATCG